MSDLNEMWTALERYQPYADKAGHGEAWRRMTTERTREAAMDAAATAAQRRFHPAANAVAAWAAMDAAAAAARAVTDFTQSISCINRAMKEATP